MKTIPPAIAGKLPEAAKLIADLGLDQAKIEDIALVTGVPKATLYYYFSGKEELLCYLLESWLDKMRDAAIDALNAPGTASDRLKQLIREQLAFMAADPDISRALFNEIGRVGRMVSTMQALHGAYYGPVEALLEEGAADGSLRPVDDPASTAAAIFGAVSICALSRLYANHDLAAEEVGAHVVSLIIDGVGAEGAPWVVQVSDERLTEAAEVVVRVSLASLT